MCVYKAIVLFIAVLFSISKVHGSQHIPDADTSFSGIAFEILLSKLELLQDKLVEMDVKSDQKIQGIEQVISKLSATISQNLSSVKTQSIITEQTVNVKHQQLYEKIQQLASKEDLARFKLNPEIYYQNISFTSCKANPLKRSSKYNIQPIRYSEPFLGYCEQTTFDGGWLVVQYRYDGSVDFYRSWDDYRNGFGSIDGEFWLGLEHLHRLTSARPHELLVELKDFKGNYIYARYSVFEIGSEAEQYPLRMLGSYSGTAGNSFTWKGNKFTTKDRDNDDYSNSNWAEKYHGGWWYSYYTYSNLNGRYVNEGGQKTIFWYKYREDFRGFGYSRILIREV